MYSKYGHGDTLVVLSLLYPWADLKHNFHIDHIFPKSSFTAKRLKAKGVADDKIDDFMSEYNYLGNLQLLEEIPNIEKKAMDFETWLNEKIPAGELDDYKKKHYIPNVNLDFSNFDKFIEEREKLIIQELKNDLRK